ncbi:MAG TPA: DMT family transporter [Gemmatimonadaceae bacterium]|nr:DMT family transporter [Gemmatimonadaceae bacterium]
MPHALRGIAWLLAAELLYVVMRLGTRANAGLLPWPLLAATRFFGGALIVASVAGWRGASLRVQDRRGTWMRSLFGAGSAVGVFYALGTDRIAVGDAATLSATAPFFVAMLSRPLLGEAVTRWVALAIAIGFAGAAILVSPSFHSAAPVAAIALAGAASYAMAMIWLRRVGPNESSEAVALHVSLVSGTILGLIGVVALASGTVTLSGRPPQWGALAAAAVAGGLGQIAVTRAFALERAATLGAVSYAGVALTYLAEAVVLGHRPGPAQLGGAALIVAAGVLTVMRGRAPVVVDGES